MCTRCKGDSNMNACNAILWCARGAEDTRCRCIEPFPLDLCKRTLNSIKWVVSIGDLNNTQPNSPISIGISATEPPNYYKCNQLGVLVSDWDLVSRQWNCCDSIFILLLLDLCSLPTSAGIRGAPSQGLGCLGTVRNYVRTCCQCQLDIVRLWALLSNHIVPQMLQITNASSRESQRFKRSSGDIAIETPPKAEHGLRGNTMRVDILLHLTDKVATFTDSNSP